LSKTPPKLTRIKRLLLENMGPTCWYCKGKFREKDIYLDHVIPKSSDGKNDEENLVLACYACNSSKSNSSLKNWLESCEEKKSKAWKEYKYRREISKTLRGLIYG